MTLGRALAATSHPMASEAAVDVLRDGGNAVDAAVCAAAVLGVVEPYASGIGGDCFAILVPGGDVTAMLAYNGSGRASRGVGAGAAVARESDRIDPQSADAVTVPGAVEAWARLVADHGTRTLGQLLRPAAVLAEDGCVVTKAVAMTWAANAERLRNDPTSREVLLPGGHAPRAGDRHASPRLGATLRRIGEQGPSGFYDGPVARDLVDLLRAHGGAHDLDDFACARGEYVQPVSRSYRGARVWECPPNGQGVTALQLLGIIEGFDASGWDPLDDERLHVLIEASRLALADRNRSVGDAGSAVDAVAELLAPARLRELRSAVDSRRAGLWAPPAAGAPHRDTTYLSVLDGDGALVSLCSSIFDPFGSGLMGPRSGVLLHCRGAGFVRTPGHPNRIAPGRRPMHTIIPAVAVLPDRRLLGFGVTGGDYQAPGQAYLIGNLVDHGMDLQAAVDLPRVQPTADGAILEPQISRATAAALARRGHRVLWAKAPIGSSQMIAVDRRSGVLDGAADRRRDGTVLRA